MDEITFTLAAEAKDAPTATAILGPFFRADTPYRENGEDIVKTKPADAEMAFMHGQVMDFETKEPLIGATVEVWQASTNGLYEQQDPDQVEFNLRGKFRTNEEGKYWFYCLRPTPYPVPDDGPAGKLLELMDRHPFRPAHIHLIVSDISFVQRESSGAYTNIYKATKENYRPLTTQIFDRKDKYLDNDSVFAVKDSLVVDFVPRKGDPQSELELNYDVKLVKDSN